MEKHTLRYLETLLNENVLRFGQFTTKSGRQSPYFFNTGNICSAHSLKTTADAYAAMVQKEFGNEVENFYGPAYKGIPLAVATAQSYAGLTGHNVTYTFNRKEAKEHGEGGSLVGAPYDLKQNVVVVEDVLTAGTSLRESLTLLQEQPVKVLGVVVGIDRQEKGPGGSSASEEIADQFQTPIYSLIKLDDIITALWNKKVLGKVWINDQTKQAIEDYRSKFCV